MAVVHRRIGMTSSSASFASRAAEEEPNGPRYAHPSPGAAARTIFSRGNASAGSTLRYA